MPVSCAAEISAVRRFRSGISLFSRVDFPTPEWPENRVVRFSKLSRSADAGRLQGRTGMAGIADGGVQVHHAFHVTEVVGILAIGLVENERYRNAVRFGRSQETVDEGGGSFRMADGYD